MKTQVGLTLWTVTFQNWGRRMSTMDDVTTVTTVFNEQDGSQVEKEKV